VIVRATVALAGDSFVPEDERTYIQFDVQDSGVGIPSTDVARIFEKFGCATNETTGGESGTGLGLAIARQLVEAHGGRIWVKSEPGQGSCFSFVIPTYAFESVSA